MALGVSGRLRPQIIPTFGTTRVVGHQPCTPAAFTPGEIPGTHFQRLLQPQGTWFCRKEPRKKSPVTPLGIDPGTVRLVAQRLNHYATPGSFPIQIAQHFSNLVILHTYLPMKTEQSVPKLRHIKFRYRGITQKKAYNIQNRAKVWNKEYYNMLFKINSFNLLWVSTPTKL